MIQRKVLKNGMTVVLKERKNGVVGVAFAVRFGGMNESVEHKGIAHFIEHMLYKGTPTRNAQQISNEIERNGGVLNGFTSEQVTAFWCKMPSKHLDVALDVLSDMVKNPQFDPKEVDKERQVIFDEMKMYVDDPGRHIYDKLKEKLYSGDFAISVIGTKESMESNSRERLKEFFDRIYKPKNLMLCVVGEANFEDLCKFAEENFSGEGEEIENPEIKLDNGEEIEKRKGIDQANLAFGYHTELDDKTRYASQILMTLMAGGMSSRLFSEIREKRNLAYYIHGSHETEGKYAYNLITVGTNPQKVDEVKQLILKEFEKVSKELDEKELQSVKDQIIGNHFLSSEDSHNVLANLIISEIIGKAEDLDNYVENIQSVKLEDVKDLAKIKDYSFFALVPE